jgi:hypothetical protein
MTTCEVHGPKPDSGPKELTAKAVLDETKEDHEGWCTNMTWSQDKTTYTSNVASEDDFTKWFEPKFPGFTVTVFD